MTAHNFKDLTGKRFGRWAVLARTEHVKRTRWQCQCDCGVVRVVVGNDLVRGKSTNCGCAKADRAALNIRRTHRAEYHSWVGMRQRCTYGPHIEFHRYGGRGITVCDEWADFAVFLRDMGSLPARNDA